ncbi:MAG: hypothetical protein RLY93_13130 [Sumerlaeia bacterium]
MRLAVLSLVCLILFMLRPGTLPAQEPALAEFHRTVARGEAMTLSGVDFTAHGGDLAGTDTRVWVAPAADPERGTAAAIWETADDLIVAGVPEDLPGTPFDPFWLWVETDAGESEPVAVNQPEVRWIGPLGDMAEPGAMKRAFGVNLTRGHRDSEDAGAPAARDLAAVTLERPGAEPLRCEVLRANPYAVWFRVPPQAEAGGRYTVAVDTGVGGEAGRGRLEDALEILAPQAPAYTRAVAVLTDNAREAAKYRERASEIPGLARVGDTPRVLGVWTCDGGVCAVDDCTTPPCPPVLDAATRALSAAGGGTLLFAGSRFTISEPIMLDSNTRLMGAAPGAQTVLTFQVTKKRGEAFISVPAKASGIAVENVTLAVGGNANIFAPSRGVVTGPIASADHFATDVVIRDVKARRSGFTGYPDRSFAERARDGQDFHIRLNAHRVEIENLELEGQLVLIGSDHWLHGENLFHGGKHDDRNWGAEAPISVTPSRFVMEEATVRTSVAFEDFTPQAMTAKRMLSSAKHPDVLPWHAYIADNDAWDTYFPGNKGEIILYHVLDSTFGQVASVRDGGRTIVPRGDGLVLGEDLWLRDPRARPMNTVRRGLERFGILPENARGLTLVITHGRGLGQYRAVERMDPEANTITVAEPWRVAPDQTSAFLLLEAYGDQVQYRNRLRGIPENVRARLNPRKSASTAIRLDGNCFGNIAEGNRSWGTASARTIAADMDAPNYWNVMRGEAAEDVLGDGFLLALKLPPERELCGEDRLRWFRPALFNLSGLAVNGQPLGAPDATDGVQVAGAEHDQLVEAAHLGFAVFRAVPLSGRGSVELRADTRFSHDGGTLNVHLDSLGSEPVARVDVPLYGCEQTIRVDVPSLDFRRPETRDVYLSFTGRARAFQMDWGPGVVPNLGPLALGNAFVDCTASFAGEGFHQLGTKTYRDYSAGLIGPMAAGNLFQGLRLRSVQGQQPLARLAEPEPARATAPDARDLFLRNQVAPRTNSRAGAASAASFAGTASPAAGDAPAYKPLQASVRLGAPGTFTEVELAALGEGTADPPRLLREGEGFLPVFVPPDGERPGRVRLIAESATASGLLRIESGGREFRLRVLGESAPAPRPAQARAALATPIRAPIRERESSIGPVFEDSFEDGVFPGPSWTRAGGAEPGARARIERVAKTKTNPDGGAYFVVLDNAEPGDESLANPALELRLERGALRGRELTLEYAAIGFSEEESPLGKLVSCFPHAGPFAYPGDGTGLPFDGIAVSTDRRQWFEIQPLRGCMLTNKWAPYRVDLSERLREIESYAPGALDAQAPLFLRFNVSTSGAHDDKRQRGGIGIDDVRVLAESGRAKLIPARTEALLVATPGEAAAPIEFAVRNVGDQAARGWYVELDDRGRGWMRLAQGRPGEQPPLGPHGAEAQLALTADASGLPEGSYSGDLWVVSPDGEVAGVRVVLAVADRLPSQPVPFGDDFSGEGFGPGWLALAAPGSPGLVGSFKGEALIGRGTGKAEGPWSSILELRLDASAHRSRDPLVLSFRSQTLPGETVQSAKAGADFGASLAPADGVFVSSDGQRWWFAGAFPEDGDWRRGEIDLTALARRRRGLSLDGEFRVRFVHFANPGEDRKDGAGFRLDDVQVVAGGRPALAIEPARSLLLYGEDNAETEGSLAIRNAGGGVMRWRAESRDRWLRVEPESGELWGDAVQTVRFIVDASRIRRGGAEGTVLLETEAGEKETVRVEWKRLETRRGSR